jgi:hypothetical protein
LDITWSVHPIHAESFNGRGQVIRIFGLEFHEAPNVVGLARGLANEVHMICRILDGLCLDKQ